MENSNEQQVTPTAMSKDNDFKLTTEEKIKSFGTRLKSGIPLIIAICIAIWWVFYGMIQIGSVTLSIAQRVELTIVTILFGWTYRQLISNGGYLSAKESKQWKQVTRDWNEAIRKSNGIKDEINLYAKDLAKNNQRLVRKENLEGNELVYSDFFDAQGNFINPDFKANAKYTKKQKKIIQQCVQLKIVIPTLFGNLSSKFFGIKKEEVLKEHQAVQNAISFVQACVIGFISAGLTFTWLGITLEAFIYAFFQITMWSATAVVGRLNNFNYVLDTIAPQIVEKTLIINDYMALDEATKKHYQSLVEENHNIKKIETITQTQPIDANANQPQETIIKENNI